MLCSCASDPAQSTYQAVRRAEAARKPEAPVGTVVTLPPPGIDVGAGSLDSNSAKDIASRYFWKYVSGCGMPDSPVDRGVFWSVQLWGGYAGSDYGRMWLSKDGSSVLLEAPKRGFNHVTKSMLSAQGILYE